MQTSAPPPCPRRASYRFTDPVEFAAMLPGGRFEILALPGEAFDTSVEVRQLPGLTLRAVDSSPHMSRAMLDAGSTTLFMQAQPGEAGLRLNGLPLPLAAVGVAAGGGDLTLVAKRRVRGIILQLPFSLTEGFCDGWPVRFTAQAGVQMLDAAGTASDRLADELRAAAGMLDEWPDALLAHEHAERLGLSLQELTAAALAADGAPAAPQRAVREAVRVLRRVEDLLFSRLSEPIYTTQVCDALKISPRKLHDSIVATCGMSPHAYLKIRRLTLARRTLRTAAPEARLVKRVAIAQGFWHFGNFAQDYRKLFGETPSDTFWRAVGDQAARDEDRGRAVTRRTGPPPSYARGQTGLREAGQAVAKDLAKGGDPMQRPIILNRLRRGGAWCAHPRLAVLGALWLLGACSAPDYTPMRDWAGTASRAADYPALAATCHVRPSAGEAQQAVWAAGARAMQTALSLYLSGLETLAADGVLPHREDPLTAEAAQAAVLDEAAGRAVAGLGALLRRATRRNARAPELAETIAEGDPHLQAVIAALSSSIGTIATAAAAERTALAARSAEEAARSRDPATRRLTLDVAALQDREYALRELARARYLAALAGIAEGHALLVERQGRLSQEATARAVRRADDQLRRIADQLPQVLGPPHAGAPCAAATPTPDSPAAARS